MILLARHKRAFFWAAMAKFELVERDDTVKQVCALMYEGQSLRQSCKAVGMSHSTFQKWLREDPALLGPYNAAREAMMDKWADEIMTLADAPVEKTPAGATDMGAVNQRKIQIEARKWLLGKLAPKKYGDKVEITSDGTVNTIQSVVMIPSKQEALPNE